MEPLYKKNHWKCKDCGEFHHVLSIKCTKEEDEHWDHMVKVVEEHGLIPPEVFQRWRKEDKYYAMISKMIESINNN